MKEPYREGRAVHPDPKSCVGGREAAGEALIGAHAGQPLSREIRQSGVPTPFSHAEGNTSRSMNASSDWTPRGPRPCACVEPPCARTGRSQGYSSRVERRVAGRRPEAVGP
jgi:hypothetical protein